jgi:hypothetical protein
VELATALVWVQVRVQWWQPVLVLQLLLVQWPRAQQQREQLL